MRIVIKTIDEVSKELEGVSQLTFGDDADAACSYISVSFTDKENLGEVDSVKVYDGDKLIFNGFCDLMKKTSLEDKNRYYIYARSSASLLLDNEAKPFTYFNPTASFLFSIYAKELGFTDKLPDISCDALYEVQKGSSCFGAVNNFVNLFTGSRIYVNPENEIMLLAEGESADINDFRVLEATEVINRSEPISSVVYKRDSAEHDYSVNAYAGISDELKINRKRYINLGSLPKLQRDFTVMRNLEKSYEKYKTLELLVDGYADIALFTGIKYPSDQNNKEYILYEKKYTSDGRGSRTKLLFREKIDIKEITYVD